ncbi:hypothetical protein [Halostagnicola sp. A-GB9-2]|uniref:hypothetical protein n=1 Tax=Halostagnicola sp. A-GB9-2 TaxID=3048066 RepID=UPI0024C0646B|nr:hypothetical protein [Halostagnicola sp. A-GB9-2]MDJ1434769.1 hypothetical protein [Halostagnicola sp. A-GB9-2]
MSERFTIELGDATHAVDYNQLTALLHGYGHVDGFEYGLVGGTDLEFDGGEAFVDGSVVEADAQTLEFGEEIDPAGELPRKDVIVVDGNGDLVVETGTENEQVGGSRRGARHPSPFPLVDLAGTPIAEVWVDKYVTELEDDDITDRRLTSELDIHTFSAVTGAFEEATVSSVPENDQDVVRKAEADALSNDLESAVSSLEEGKADDPHSLGGDSHDSDTLENLNSKVSDAMLDGEGSSRPPENHAEDHQAGGGDELDAGNLSGESGEQDQLLATDGNSTFWSTPTGGLFTGSEDNTLSDISLYEVHANDDYLEVVDISGEGILMGGLGVELMASDTHVNVEIIVDGQTTVFEGPVADYNTTDSFAFVAVPTLYFENELIVNMAGSGETAANGMMATCYIKHI